MFYRTCNTCAAVHPTKNGGQHPWQCARCFTLQHTKALSQEEFDRYAARTKIVLVDPKKDELHYAVTHKEGGFFLFPVFREGKDWADVYCEHCKKFHRYLRPEDSTVTHVVEPVIV